MSSSQPLPAIRSGSQVTQQAFQGLSDFEKMMLDHVRAAGLPTDNIVVALNQRFRLLTNVDGALEELEPDQRERASYISKMILAASVGLFDAALNYLWDETISELRKRVVAYDLEYFFSAAEKSDRRRQELKTAEDLVKLDDSKLVEGAREVGLVSDVGFHQLDHIRYMRNYASAAHPNQVTLTGLDLASWLETCIREVITRKDTVAADIQKLLINVRTKKLAEADVATAATFFDNLAQPRVDTLASGLFTTYTTFNASPDTLDNIRLLWPKLWRFTSEDTRHGFGYRLARFNADADFEQRDLARQLIDLVEGSTYLPTELRATELAEALQDLLDVHRAFNNFYNEPPVARRLAELVGEHGSVPPNLAGQYVWTVVDVFLTNGNGVAWSADSVYKELIGKFDPDFASLALRSFQDDYIASKLTWPLAQQKWAELIGLIKDKLTGRRDRDLLDSVVNFAGSPAQLRLDADIKRQLAAY